MDLRGLLLREGGDEGRKGRAREREKGGEEENGSTSKARGGEEGKGRVSSPNLKTKLRP